MSTHLKRISGGENGMGVPGWGHLLVNLCFRIEYE